MLSSNSVPYYPPWLIHLAFDPIDLLITDVVMPEMNGKELKDRIEAMQPNIRVLFMSGYTSQIIQTRGVLMKN